MESIPKSPARVSFSERLGLGVLIAFTLLTRVPFLDMGFGRADAWRVGVTGKFWAMYGEYSPSRPPGFPLTEIASALSYLLFHGSPITWTVTNSLTCLFFLAAVYGVWALAKKWDLPNPLVVATVFAFAPLNWVYSVETIDYLWMTSLIILAILAMETPGRSSPFWTGILLGLATSARFSAAFLIVPIAILIWVRGRSWRELFLFVLPFAVVALGFYSVVIVSTTGFKGYLDWFNHLNQMTSGMAEISGGTLKSRFLMPAARLFGPLASVAFVLAGLWGLPRLVGLLRKRDRGAWVGFLLAFFLMAPYIWHLHQNYWIPATGFILLLLAMSVRPMVFVLVGALIIAANFPGWQSGVERLGLIPPVDSGSPLALFRSGIAQYQNETIFGETEVRLFLWGTVDSLVKRHDLPDNAIVMAGSRLPLVKFIIPDIQYVELPLAGGGTFGVWTRTSGGPKYAYLLSPKQVAVVTASGYHAVFVPGMERVYFAEYNTYIQNVPDVQMLTSERAQIELNGNE